MKKTVDSQTMTDLNTRLLEMFGLTVTGNTAPDFELKKGLWVHKNKHSVTVITDDKEIESPEGRGDYTPLLGIYKIDSVNKSDKFYLFPDSIKLLSKRYADYKSIVVEKGKIIGDVRNTHDSWGGEGKPNGLFESQAYSQIEIICKLELISFWLIHRLPDIYKSVWISKFYNEENSDYIDILVMQLTKDTIQEYCELEECFEWLSIKSSIVNSKFCFNTPILFIEKLKGTKVNEWQIINSLDIFINCFPIENKENGETWEIFFSRTKENVQDSFIKLVKEHGSGWEIVKEYLTPDNLKKYSGRITGVEYGLDDAYTRKWWKTWP